MLYREASFDQPCHHCDRRCAAACARCAAPVCDDHREDDLCDPCDREFQRGRPPADLPIMGPLLGSVAVATIAAFIAPPVTIAALAVGIAWVPIQVLRRGPLERGRRRRYIAAGKGRQLLRERT